MKAVYYLLVKIWVLTVLKLTNLSRGEAGSIVRIFSRYHIIKEILIF